MRWLYLHVAAIVVGLPLRLAAAPDPPSCALAPTAEAEAVLRESGLEAGLFGALAGTGACELQALSHTATELSTARGMGFDCAPEDTECLRKLAALLQVQRIIGVAARVEGDSTSLTLTLVSAQGGEQLASVERTVPASGPERSAMLQDVADGLLSPAGDLVQTEEPVGEGAGAREQVGEGAGAGDQELAQVLEGDQTGGDDGGGVAEEPAPETTEVVGWSLVGVGGGVAAVGALGVASIESTLFLTGAGDYDTRSSMLLADKVLAGVAVLGAVAGVVGLGIVIREGGE